MYSFICPQKNQRGSIDFNAGYGWILLAGVAWGSIGVFGRWLLDTGLTPWQVAWVRSAVALPGLLLLLLCQEGGFPRLKRRDLILFAAFGLVNGALYNIFYFTAVELVGVTVAVILLYTAPAFATLLARFVFKEQLSWGKAVAVVLSLGGCFLVARGYDVTVLRLNLMGITAGIMSGICYACFGLFAKKARERFSAVTTVFYCTLIGWLLLTIIRPPLGLAPLVRTGSFWGSALGLGLWGTLVPWVSYSIGVAQVEASRAAVVASVEPVVGVALAVTLLGERIQPGQIVGMILVLTAVMCAQSESLVSKEVSGTNE